MPERASVKHLIGFPRSRTPDHSHYVQGYLYTCEAEGKTVATVASYRENLTRFLKAVEYLGLPRQPSLVLGEQVRRYLAHLRECGSSAATVNDRLTVLRLWYKWLLVEGFAEEDPTRGVAKAKDGQKLLATLTVQQVQDLLRLCQREGIKRPQARRKAGRGRAIILLLYNSGLRASELVGLDLGDVDFDRMLVHVRHGRGRRQRIVALGKVPRQALWRYVANVRGSEPGPLFKNVQEEVEQLDLFGLYDEARDNAALSSPAPTSSTAR